jgi:predicted nucleotidyltransferase
MIEDDDEAPRKILLSGVVGSTAYGLDHEGSDIDRMGLFAYPTMRWLGLHLPKDSIHSTRPDITLHEARKFVGLALNGNPSIMELMWLKDYEVQTAWGADLIEMRQAFLNKHSVRNAYLGYAQSQFKRLQTRGNGTFSADLGKRTEKHSRHLMRLVEQGFELYTTRNLTIRVKDPEKYHEFGRTVAAGHLNEAQKYLMRAEERFNGASSPLPDRPDEDRVQKWLLGVRKDFFFEE